MEELDIIDCLFGMAEDRIDFSSADDGMKLYNFPQAKIIAKHFYNKALGDAAQKAKGDPWGEINQAEILSLKIID